MKNLNIKTIISIILLHGIALFITVYPFFKKDNLCIQHKREQNIVYLKKGDEILIVNDAKLILVPQNKKYINENYLNSFFEEVSCPADLKSLEIDKSGSFSETLRESLFEQDSRN